MFTLVCSAPKGNDPSCTKQQSPVCEFLQVHRDSSQTLTGLFTLWNTKPPRFTRGINPLE